MEGYKKAIKAIEKLCVEPLTHILKICATKDSDADKLLAIKFYCAKILVTINDTVEKELK
jgi:hypothetical protein